MRIVTLVLCLSCLSFLLEAQADSRPILPPIPAESTGAVPLTGDAAIARRYMEWAQREVSAGRTAEALAALERGADFGAASSDISYLLAVLRSIENRSRFSVLEACRLALETNRWDQYKSEDARLLEAKTLSELRRFEEALNVLERCDPEKFETQNMRLLALRGLARLSGQENEFAETLTLIMDRFPRETAPIRLLFDYAAQKDPNNNLRPLIDLAIRRLPVLADSDPELAYKAVPFLPDREEARRYTASYRAKGNPNPASLPAALELGLVSGMQAVEELFAFRQTQSGSEQKNPEKTLDRELIAAVNSLLRSEDERSYLRRNLLQFSGVLTEDRDHDGIIETWVTYKDGMIREYQYDSDQDGEPNLTIAFAQGIPERAEIAFVRDVFAQVFPLNGTEQGRIQLRWERYPAVLDVELEEKRYIFRPLDYFFTPVRFTPLVFGGPDFPLQEEEPFLTERSLLSFAAALEQPSEDFPEGTERIELSDGIPVKSTVHAGGRKVSETEFRLGRPVIQYLDTDMDGRMETRRRYDPNVAYRVIETESDWDGDGMYEYAEIVQDDGSIRILWDLDRDGIRETEHYRRMEDDPVIVPVPARGLNHVIIALFSGAGSANMGTTWIDAANTRANDIRNTANFRPSLDSVTVHVINSIPELAGILSEGNIDSLSIFGHGGSDYITVGSGQGTGRREYLMAGSFSALNRNAFNDGAVITLYSCSAASEVSRGFYNRVPDVNMARAMAAYFGVETTGYVGGALSAPRPDAPPYPDYIHRSGSPVYIIPWSFSRTYGPEGQRRNNQ